MTHPGDDRHEQFIALFLQSEAEVLRYVLAIVPDLDEAREIVQGTAIELWRKFADYDPTRPFTPWACRFALRQTQTHLRQRQKWRIMLNDELLFTLASEHDQSEDTRQNQLMHLTDCLAKLPGEQREVVRLYYDEGVRLPEMAARLGRSVDALYKSLQRIRAALLACIEQAEGHVA